MGDVDVGIGEMVLEDCFDDLAILFVTATRTVIMDGLDSVWQRRAMVHFYKTLFFGIIWVESFGIETLFDNVPIQENPFHFGRASIDNQSHVQ